MGNRNHTALFLTFFLALLAQIVTAQTTTRQLGWGGREEAQARTTAGKALFEEKCQTVAGEKIFRTVSGVEGIVLLKIRAAGGEHEWRDQMWPGAAFAIEAWGDSYINTFLGYEYAPGHGLTGKSGVIASSRRGYIATDHRPDGLPGYRFVNVVDDKDRQQYRYVLVRKPRPQSQIGSVDIVLERSPASEPRPRYGVTFEDYVVHAERILGIASGTVRVIDLETQEVLGEMTRYAWSPGGPSNANPSPWLTAYRCPAHAVGSNAATRKFVDQILIPRREK